MIRRAIVFQMNTNKVLQEHIIMMANIIKEIETWIILEIINKMRNFKIGI